LTSMVCQLTIGKRKYAGVEKEMKKVLDQSEALREKFAALVDEDTEAFNKVMEAYSLPKDSDDQNALRTAAIQEATKEAALVPLSVMNYIIDALALTRVVAEKGNTNSISDAGVSAFMLRAAAEGAALNVQINLQTIIDSEFVGWRSDEVATLLRTAQSATEEILAVVRKKINNA
jgi:formiminotetrahydrofolate cyclodeaminase